MERPILFSTPMVQAILGGRKTQTRRIIKPQPNENGIDFNLRPPCLDWEQIYKERWKVWHYETDEGENIATDGKYQIGDILWVRETYNHIRILFGGLQRNDWPEEVDCPFYCYKADDETYLPKWKPSIFMPKEACRIKLEITNIRVERLQDISEEDALLEGIESSNEFNSNEPFLHQYKDYLKNDFECDALISYRTLWEKINGKGSWKKNPWVWVIEFQKTK